MDYFEMTTPENLVKAKTRQVLAEYDGLYTHWPVPAGFGKRTIDCLACYRGRFFGIETKAPGKKPTLNQVKTIRDIELAMGRVFVIDDVRSPVLDELREWLDGLKDGIQDDHRISPDQVARRPI